MSKVIRLLVFSVLSLCYSSIASTQNNEFVKFFNSFERLSANFEQTTYGDNNVVLATASGKLLFARPKQLLWQTNKPSRQTLLLNKNMWLIDFALEQASLQQITDLQQTPLYWLVNRPSEIKHLPKYTYQQDGLNWYLTEQKNALRFGFKNNGLHAISLTNKLAQTIQILFSEVMLNPNIEPSAFELTINPTFDVIW